MFSTYISRIWWLKNDDSRILYFWQVLGSIQKFIIQLHALQCLFVRGSNKQQRSGRIIFKFHKRTDFFVFYDNQVLLGVISQCAPSPPPPPPPPKKPPPPPPLLPLQRRPSSSLQFGHEENIPGYSTGRRAYWFVLKIARVFPIPTGRAGIE